ncbi:lectin [Actinospica sp. MGRD01-02]|uniref:Lectin n=1 Tax=Actinospica acidithermotolerans TaxID=2828514 RepID=A0A941IKI1_9ACTN|nr:lectin [Actinospica acidithermotolerans]MBR7826736.1 lectin [Actinospica acidithermotolerans]
MPSLPTFSRRTRMRAAVPVVAAVTLGLGALAPGASAATRVAISSNALVTDPGSYVNPLIGTTNSADDFPGADVPYGMVQWSPDTPSRPDGGGYEYTDSSITGFSLTHMSGPGCPAEGDVPVLPTVGAVDTGANDSFSHTGESASPGYYSVQTSNGVTTELTATTRTGMARFTFPATTQANLIFKLNDSANGDSATQFDVVSDTEVRGSVTSGYFCGATNTYTVYFDMVFDHPFTTDGTDAVAATLKKAATDASKNSAEPANKPAIHGAQPKTTLSKSAAGSSVNDGYVTFDTSNSQVVQAKVGISYVSGANAVANRKAENPGWNFNSTKAAAASAWNKQLDQIRIEGGTVDQDTVFYTALYHASLHPNVVSDVNGQYPGFDGKVHTVDSGHAAVYGNYSGWDIYRSQAQLEALIDPQIASDTAESMLDDYAQTGEFPKWSNNNGETYVMVGDPSDEILADYYSFGARDWDTSTALKDMVAEATTTNDDRPGLNYISGSSAIGYLPADGTYGCCNFYGPVSTQLEYDSADYAIASLAKATGDKADYAKFAARANNWTNVYNPASGFMQPRLANGSWLAGFNPSSGTDFVEGSSWQYTGMVPFNIAGLAAADGGAANYASTYLDQVLSGIDGGSGNKADFSNEPSLELPWEYDYTGQPYKTQKDVRQVQDQIWTDSPSGLAGNDDLGEMSSWYVWSALGMYPETPGTSTLALGSPLFPKAVVKLASGKTLTINGKGAAAAAPYVQSATWNSGSWNDAYAPADATTKGGTLSFTLGTTPNTSWASLPTDAPPSDSTGEASVLAAVSPGSGLILAPSGSGSAKLVASNLTSSPTTVKWSESGSGVTVSPSSSTLTVPAHSTASVALKVTAGATEGSYPVTFAMSSGGTSLLPSTLSVDVASPGELWPYYTNIGISTDGGSSAADYDGDGYSYSANALAAQNVTPGATITSDGVSYTWPNVQAGALDNIEANGQTIPLQPTTATKIGLLGSATNAPSTGTTGTLTVTYTDGTTQQIPVNFGDWTLGAGSETAPSGDQTIASTTYRNADGGTSNQTVNTYLFAVDGTLTAGKTVASVTLPSPTDGDFHVFAIGFAQ